MKLSLRFPFGLLVLIAICTVLRFRAAVRSDSPGPEGTAVPDPPLNGTLLRLAAIEPGEAEMRKDVEELLGRNNPAAVFGVGRHRSISLWRRENHHQEGRVVSAVRYPIRLRTTKDYQIFPEFRRYLRDWFRSRRFQPGVMSELLALVRRPLDRHHGRPDTDRPYGSCAVVGNSGILLRHDHGDLIDGHDMVIRLNNARVVGYQRNVGSKTGLSFVNSNILHLCARRESCFCHPYGPNVPMIMYICQAIHFLDYLVCNSSHKAPLLITDPRLDVLCARMVNYYSLKRFVEETGKPPEEWRKAHNERTFHYSSGMQAIVLALGICDRVSVFGFGKSSDAKHHYHSNQKAELDLHDYEAEYAFYRDLIERPQAPARPVAAVADTTSTGASEADKPEGSAENEREDA